MLSNRQWAPLAHGARESHNRDTEPNRRGGEQEGNKRAKQEGIDFRIRTCLSILFAGGWDWGGVGKDKHLLNLRNNKCAGPPLGGGHQAAKIRA